MDISRHQNEIASRRLRLISDITEDYQENIRRTLRLLEMDLDLQERQYIDSFNSNANLTGIGTGTGTGIGNRSRNRNQTGSRTRGAFDPFRTNSPFLRAFSNVNRDFRNYGAREGLTAEDIERCTTRLTYELSMNLTQCPITWDNFTEGQPVMRINGCGHVFSCNGLLEWFRRNNRCPICRSHPVLQSANTEYPPRPPTTQAQYDVLATDGTADQAHIPVNIFGFSTSVSLDGEENAQQQQPNLSDQIAQETPNIMNAIMSGLVEGLQTMTTNNQIPATDYFEREYTFSLNDILRQTPNPNANNPDA